MQCQEGLFLIGPSYRPVRVDEAEFCGYEDTFGDKEANRPPGEKVHIIFVHCMLIFFLQYDTRFAQPHTMEFDFAMKWRDLAMLHKSEMEELKERHRLEVEHMWRLQAETKNKLAREHEDRGRKRVGGDDNQNQRQMRYSIGSPLLNSNGV